MIDLPFANRIEAGQLLGRELARHGLPAPIVVLGLPRGGVPVAFEIAKALHAPLDVVVVRKIGVPWQPELALGAVAGDTLQILNQDLIAGLRISRAQIDSAINRERAEVKRREALYRGAHPSVDLREHTVVLADDGLATGATMQIAVQYVQQFHPAKTIIAVPVGSGEACERLSRIVDDLVCLAVPRYFQAVGAWYTDFRQTGDDEVEALLEQNRTACLTT